MRAIILVVDNFKPVNAEIRSASSDRLIELRSVERPREAKSTKKRIIFDEYDQINNRFSKGGSINITDLV